MAAPKSSGDVVGTPVKTPTGAPVDVTGKVKDPVDVTHKTEPAVKVSADEFWALVEIALGTLGIKDASRFGISDVHRHALVVKIVDENWDAAPFSILGRFKPKKPKKN